MSPENRRAAIATQLRKASSALASAELLWRGGFNDDAVSRAYYAVFHAARAALLTLGLQPRTHKGVNQRFNADLVIPGKIEAEYLSLLGRAQMNREAADYSVERELSPAEAQVEVEGARRFIERMRSYVDSTGLLDPH